ncbi:MAG: hypothetical protein AABY22_08690 [Nanoarchaeota archaeon]
MTEKKSGYNISWHKDGIKCIGCGKTKAIDETRYEKIKKSGMINKYKCRSCRTSANTNKE